MTEAIELIRELLLDEMAWLAAFPHCSETEELIHKARSFLEEYEDV